MFRALVPLAVALVLLAGCKKKPADTGAGDGTVDGDPNATYTIKLLKTPRQGDRADFSATKKNVSEADGKSRTVEELIEYTETIVEMPDGAAQPTKLTREFRKVRKTDPTTNQLKAASYEGKTVTIEKTKFGYSATADGKPLPPAESAAVTAAVYRPDREEKSDAMLPKGAVKVGETWSPDPEVARKMFGSFPMPIDQNSAKVTGKLARAYTKDGKQWGVLVYEFDVTLVPGGGKGRPDMSGTAKFTLTLDAVIDGSARDAHSTITVKADISVKIQGKDNKVLSEATNTETIKMLK